PADRARRVPAGHRRRGRPDRRARRPRAGRRAVPRGGRPRRVRTGAPGPAHPRRRTPRIAGYFGRPPPPSPPSPPPSPPSPPPPHVETVSCTEEPNGTDTPPSGFWISTSPGEAQSSLFETVLLRP